MNEFTVTVKGKEYKSGFVNLAIVQRAMVIQAKITQCEKKLGLLPPIALSETMTEDEQKKYESEVEAYITASTPDDPKLWEEYKRLWMSLCGCFIANPPAELSRDTLDDKDFRGLVSFFVSVKDGLIQTLSNTNGTSANSEKPVAQA